METTGLTMDISSFRSLQGHQDRGECRHQQTLQWPDLCPGQVRDLQRGCDQQRHLQAGPDDGGPGLQHPVSGMTWTRDIYCR